MSSIEQKRPDISSIGAGKLRWFYVEKPSATEVEWLAEQFHFHPLNIDDVLSRAQRPKIDEYDDHLFIVLHFPVFDKENRITRPSEVDIFVGEDYIVTVHCNGDLKPLAKFFRECEINEESRATYLGRSSGFLLYHVLDRLVNYCLPILGKVTDNVDDIEEVIFAKPVPQTVRQISLIRRDLVSFRRVIRPQISVIETLESEEYPFFKEDQEGLAETSNWLTSHRIQEVMQVLTIIMATLAPLTLLSGVYGMNIPLPGGVESGSLLPLGVLLSIMALMGGAMFTYLRRRRWI
jgi:magnesium transporter